MANSNIKNTYCGYAIDRETLMNSSSGGFATTISNEIIRMGGVVLGVRYTEDFLGAEYCVVDNESDLYLLQGSKYIVASKMLNHEGEVKSVYQLAGEFLKHDRVVLFIGLGCDIGALRSYIIKENITDTNLFTIDLICHGPTFPIVHESFVKKKVQKFKSDIIYLSVRYKKKGWVPPYLYIKFKNGKVYSAPFYDTDYGYAFEKLCRKSCLDCQYKGDNHVADITIGDFWGITKSMKEYNQNGVSLIISANEKGEKMVQYVKESGNFYLGLTDKEYAIKNNPMYASVRKQDIHFNSEQFLQNIKENNLEYAVLKQQGFIKTYFIRAYKLIRSIIPLKIKIIIMSLLKKLIKC